MNYLTNFILQISYTFTNRTMIKKVKFRPAQGQPQKWKIEASLALQCSSASLSKVLAEGLSKKDPCPDEIQVVTIPEKKVRVFRCYRMSFSGEKLPADLQIWKKNLSGNKCAHNAMHPHE